MCDVDVIGGPSKLIVIRKAEALSRLQPGHCYVEQAELLNQKSVSFPMSL